MVLLQQHEYEYVVMHVRLKKTLSVPTLFNITAPCLHFIEILSHYSAVFR